MAARVSVVIPTRNGADTLPALLDALDRQRNRSLLEVIALDSKSSDGSGPLLRQRADTVVDIDPRRFDHGLTRNLGIAMSRGELVVLIVQDAVPADDNWLDALIAPFANDERLAGTFARQLPRPDASPVTRFYHARWVAGSAAPRVSTLDNPEAFAQLSPPARFERCVFDDVCSCVRRSVWQQHPFCATPIAEDVIWAKEVLLAGFRLAYVPEATVVHSHERGARYEFKRTRILHRILHQEFQLHMIPTLPHLVRAIGWSLVTHARCERAAGATVPSARATGLALAWPLGQFLGARDSVRGRPSRRVEGV